MSDEAIPTPETPAPAQPVEITCPNCNASLRNISVETGAAIRCLNCGKRFTLPATEAVITSDASATAEPIRRRGKEPASAGYWLIRIPAMIALLVSVVGYLYAVAQEWSFSYRGGSLYWQMIFLPLWPAGAVVIFLISRTLARIDAACIASAWREEKLRDAMPTVAGSSLPYVAPLAIGGGVLPFVLLRDGQDFSEILPAMLVGGLMLYGGFMLEDVRQFIWRQGCLARAFSGKQQGEVSLSHGFWPAITLCSLSALFILAGSPARSEARFFTYCILLLIALAGTSYFLGYNLGRAIQDWVRAAEEYSRTSPAVPATPARLVMQFTPLLWAAGFVLFMLYILFDEFRIMQREWVMFSTVTVFGACAAITASRLLLQVYRWREAQFHMLKNPEISASQAVGWFRYFRIAILALVTLESVSLIVETFSQISSRSWRSNAEWCVMALMIVAVTYAPIWFLDIAGEFLAVEALWTKHLASLREQDQ